LKISRPLSDRPNSVVDCIKAKSLTAAKKVRNRPTLERVVQLPT
jgi:hypothetical protein